MTINFYLPNFSITNKINGGYKVIYQYANYLAHYHDVRIYYDLEMGKNKLKISPYIYIWIKKVILKMKYPKWFKLDKKVKQYAVKFIGNETVLNADISIATAYETAQYVYNLSDDKGVKFYFIQDYEKWNNRTDEELIESYKLNMKKIVISKWLKEKVEEYVDEEVLLVSNGIDTDNIFYITKKINERDDKSIMMLYHKNPRKGSENGIEVLNRLKKEYPQLKAYLFGSPRRENIPKWIKYKRNLNEYKVAKIMNECSIYLCTSLQEGYGLPRYRSNGVRMRFGYY